MLLSAISLNSNKFSCNNLNLYDGNSAAPKLLAPHICRATSTPSSAQRQPFSLTAANASPSSSSSSSFSALPNGSSNPNPRLLRHLSIVDEYGGEVEAENEMVSSASAIAAAIREVSSSPVDFVQRVEEDRKRKDLVLPSSDFQRLCVEQLDLFRRIVDPSALLSVYVRPAGSYVMDRLELRRVIFYPGVNADDIVVLVGNFRIPTGLRAAEGALSNQTAGFIFESGAVVFPMVKHPFVVGFLVAELPRFKSGREMHDVKQHPFPKESYAFPSDIDPKKWEVQPFMGNNLDIYKFSADQKLNAINISHSLAMAYIMDQKAMLLQQSSWQNNVRMSTLVEQIRGPLSSIRTLSKLLSIHLKRSEIAYDIVEDILVQGDRMRDTLQQLQEAVYLTKANIVHYNEEMLKKMHHSTYTNPESSRSQSANEMSISNMQQPGGSFSFSASSKDIEMPMPPLALAPLQQTGVRRPCNVSDVLTDLVGAVEPLALLQQRAVELRDLSQNMQVAIEEPALRQALSNLIEGALLRTHVGGKVEIVSTGAPAGGALVIIDDDGPDMHYMTQMRSLTPFGEDLFSEDMVEDNMTWNFVAGLTVAREILESYGCVVRVISPRTMDAAPLGAGGTRVELWLPCFFASPDQDTHAQA